MTREELRDYVEEQRSLNNIPYHVYSALIDGIDTLEQEPQSFKWCNDCREYNQEKHCCHRWSKVIRDTVEEMKQEPKTGHWNDIPKYKNIAWQCSECGRFTTMKHNYCPNCGAKMVEPESED